MPVYKVIHIFYFKEYFRLVWPTANQPTILNQKCHIVESSGRQTACDTGSSVLILHLEVTACMQAFLLTLDFKTDW